ncbi:MAG: hypothetical protein BWK78_01100 [Thiotrichaceae bacterium IS1]|nr:MAG: hypothetical protein BWK78_01100 [Thiotrichaceae bacterium IS1]
MDYHHWAYSEARTAQFGDQRLTNRFVLLLKPLGDQPEESMPAACKSWADTLAAYRVFDNEKVTFDTVLASHKGAKVKRCREHPVVLLIPDTTSLKYTHTPVAKGLGTLSEQETAEVFLSPTLAVTPQRVSLRVLGGEVWQRLETSPRKERRLKGIDEKESRRWVAGYQLACEVSSLVEETLTVNLADAEGDIDEWFAETLEHSPQTRAEWIIRVAPDRRLASSESSRQLREKLNRTPLLGKVAVTLPAKSEQEALIAILQVRTTRATLKSPARTGVRLSDLEVCAVLAREENPPLGQRPIDWTFLTSLPVTSLVAAVQILEWYIGGYLNRSLEGPPGPQAIWKGLRRVREAVWLLQVLKRTSIPQ